MKSEDEKAYPIYILCIKWVEDGEHDPEYKKFWRQKGLRKGRIRNSMHIMRMFKGKKTNKELLKEANITWKLTKKKRTTKNPSCHKIKTEFLHYETWCLVWFNHWTFDTNRTDKEEIESFEKFVRRQEEKNWKNGHREHEHTPGNENPYYELMGAEDRYRWSGNDDEGNEIDPPCRCKHCKKQGKIRINH